MQFNSLHTPDYCSCIFEWLSFYYISVQLYENTHTHTHKREAAEQTFHHIYTTNWVVLRISTTFQCVHPSIRLNTSYNNNNTNIDSYNVQKQ